MAPPAEQSTLLPPTGSKGAGAAVQVPGQQACIDDEHESWLQLPATQSWSMKQPAPAKRVPWKTTVHAGDL
jgi:hypothetical protein